MIDYDKEPNATYFRIVDMVLNERLFYSSIFVCHCVYL